MAKMKNSRGRPKGSEIDDSAVLNAIADLMLANPKLRKTSAMRKVRPKASEAEIHRWQSKWKERGEEYLADASARAAFQEDRSVGRSTSGRSATDFTAMASGVYDTAAMRIARGLELHHPTIKAAMGLVDSPAMKFAREIADNPAVRLARELENSAIMRACREHERIRKLMGL